MRIIFLYALRELINHRRFSLFFILNLSLGLIGFVVLLLTREAVENDFSQKLQAMLGADMVVQSRSKPNEAQEAWLEQMLRTHLPSAINSSNNSAPAPLFRSSRQIDTLTMLRTNEGQAKLVRVLAVEDGYPFYGDLRISNNDNNTDEGFSAKPLIATILNPTNNPNPATIWMDNATASSLGLSLGGTLTINDTPFIYSHRVVRHSSRQFGFTGFFPTVYVGRSALLATGLAVNGSRVMWKTTIALDINTSPPSPNTPPVFINSKAFEPTFKEAIKVKFDDPEFYTLNFPKDANERMRELTDRVSGFMNLISLIGLFFSGLGLGYLFRYYAGLRLQSTAIARVLGMSTRQSDILILIQLLLLTLSSLSIAWCAGQIWSVWGLRYLSQSLGYSLSVHFSLSTFLQIAVMALLSNIVFTLPVWVAMRQIKPAILLRMLPGEPPRWEDDPFYNTLKSKIQRYLSILPVLIFLWGASVYLVGLRHGSLFFVILLIVVALFYGAGVIGLMLAHRIAPSLSVNYRLALRALFHRRIGSLSGFVAIALGVFLMALLPQMAASLREEIRTPRQSVLPAFFLFDIQPDQVDELTTWIHSQKNRWYDITLTHLSPQIRGRLTHINDVPIEKPEVEAKIDPDQRQFIRQGVNVSYREGLSASETIILGKPLSPYTEAQSLAKVTVPISLEERYSKRLGVGLNDRLTFRIHGVDIHTTIANIRQVRWNSFQPNFFIQFPVGVLDMAPKIWIANLSGVPSADRNSLQSAITEKFSNISVIDVGALVEEVLGLAEKILSAVVLLALLAITAGVTVLVSVALTEVEEAEYEFGLIRALGGKAKHLRQRAFAQFIWPAILAVIVGTTIATFTANVLTQTFLQSSAVYPWRDMALLLSVTTLLLVLLFIIMGRRIEKIHPQTLLSAE